MCNVGSKYGGNHGNDLPLALNCSHRSEDVSGGRAENGATVHGWALDMTENLLSSEVTLWYVIICSNNAAWIHGFFWSIQPVMFFWFVECLIIEALKLQGLIGFCADCLCVTTTTAIFSTIMTGPKSATTNQRPMSGQESCMDMFFVCSERLIGSVAPPSASKPVFQDALQSQNLELHKRLIPDQDECLSSNENAEIYDAVPSMPVVRLFHVCRIPELQWLVHVVSIWKQIASDTTGLADDHSKRTVSHWTTQRMSRHLNVSSIYRVGFVFAWSDLEIMDRWTKRSRFMMARGEWRWVYNDMFIPPLFASIIISFIGLFISYSHLFYTSVFSFWLGPVLGRSLHRNTIHSLAASSAITFTFLRGPAVISGKHTRSLQLGSSIAISSIHSCTQSTAIFFRTFSSFDFTTQSTTYQSLNTPRSTLKTIFIMPFPKNYGALGASFTIARILQSICIIAILGMTANFIGQINANDQVPPKVLVGTLSVVCLSHLKSPILHSY